MSDLQQSNQDKDSLTAPSFLTEEKELPIALTPSVAATSQALLLASLKRRVMGRIGLFLALLLIGGVLFVWLMPKESDKGQAFALYQLIDKVDAFKDRLAWADEGDFFSYQEVLEEIPPLTTQFNAYQKEYQRSPVDKVADGLTPLNERWSRLVELVENFSGAEAPSTASLEALPQVEAEVIQELHTFTTLIIALADEVRARRSFSIETIRLIDQLTIYTTRVENSLGELFSSQQKKQATLFATLTENFNALHHGLYALEQGDYNEGVQSLLNSDFDEVLREARFIFSTLGERVETLIENAGLLVDLKFFIQRANDEVAHLKKDLLKTLITLNDHDHKTLESLYLVISLLLAGTLLFIGVIIATLQLSHAKKEKALSKSDKEKLSAPLKESGDLSATISPLISPIISKANKPTPLALEEKAIINQVKVLQEGLIDLSAEVNSLLTEAAELFKKRDAYFTHLSGIMHKINLKLNYLTHNLVSLNSRVAPISSPENQEAHQTISLLTEMSQEVYHDYKSLAATFSNYKKEQKLSHQNRERLVNINEQLSFFVDTLERVMTHGDLPESDPPTILPLQ